MEACGFTPLPNRFTLGPTQPPIQLAPGSISLLVKLPERESDNSPASSAKVKNDGAIPPLLHASS
jgi:hypothetical protein